MRKTRISTQVNRVRGERRGCLLLFWFEGTDNNTFCTLCFSFFLLVFRWEIVGRFSVPKAIVFVFDFEIIDGGQNGHGETIESGSNKTKAVCGIYGFPWFVAAIYQRNIEKSIVNEFTKVSHGEFRLVQQSKKFVPGSLIGVKDIDFVQ
jgi:hypothetical protein